MNNTLIIDANPGGDASDAELLARHAQGDEQAFTDLFLRHRHRLWSVALRTTRNPEDAADALQEAMIAAFRKATTFRGQSAVTTWLHRIVVNACLDRLRRNKVRRAEELPENLDRDLRLTSPDDPELAVDRSEMASEVAQAMAQINPDQRAALVLVDMQGYPVEDAARILGCAVGTIKSRCARGRAKLAPLLAHHRHG